MTTFNDNSESLKDFLLKLAAFYFFEFDTLPESFTVDSNIAIELNHLYTKRDEIDAWPDQYAWQKAQEFFKQRLIEHENEVEKRKERFKHLEQRLLEVEQWTPPLHPKGLLLKEIAISHLKDMIKQDCKIHDLDQIITAIGQMTGGEYKKHLLDQLNKEIEAKNEQYIQALTKASQDTRYVQDLRASLEPVPV